MKILFLWPDQLRRDLGGPKIVVEVAEAMAAWGCETVLYDPWTLPDGKGRHEVWSVRCRDYLQAHAHEFDVVDYDHGHLSYPRKDFCPKTLMVARSGLLSLHFTQIPIPDLYPIRDRIRRFIKGRGPQERYEENGRRAQFCCEQADLINVPNHDDRAELIRRGIPADKIYVFPFGINVSRHPLFSKVSPQPPSEPRVAFVGTFDARKGARDFPKVIAEVIKTVPEVKFSLFGVKGLFQTKEDILKFFPSSLHSRLELVMEYKPDDLPSLLSRCSMGIFPSYLEGFPFGVLEMLASALPVVAYRSPGAPMMVAEGFLVEPGNTLDMARKTVELLCDTKQLLRERIKAQKTALGFNWSDVAARTMAVYSEHLQALRKANEKLS